MTPEDPKPTTPAPPTRPEMARREPQRPDAGIRWMRSDHQIAARISPSDLQGRLQSGLEIQPGTRALFFVGGRYIGTMPPGRHTIETLRQKLKIPTDGEPVAIVVDDGELSFEFDVGDLHSSDHHNAVLSAQASLRLAEPEVFLSNLMRDRNLYTIGDLAGHLAAEIHESLSTIVRNFTAEDLHRGRVRGQIEMGLLSSWKATLDRSGFVLNRFRALRFVLPGLEAAEDVRSDAGDAAAVKEAYFETELADFRLDTLALDQRETAVEERRVVEVGHEVEQVKIEADRLEKRQPVLERLLQGGVLEKMTHLESEEDWRKFRLQVDKDRLIDDREWEELRRDSQAQAQEAEVKREFLFRRVKAMAEADLGELTLKRGYQLKLLELRGDAEVVQEQANQERIRLDAEISNRNKVFEQELAERGRWFEQERGEQQSVADLQMWKVERMETIRQMGKDRESARALQEKVTTAEIERKRLAQEGEMYSMMTSDQILSVAVARNPEKAEDIAKAFNAMKSGEASARERELYERMLSEVKSVHERAQTLDHEKFIIGAETAAAQRRQRDALDEREKDRVERVATANLTPQRTEIVHRHDGAPGVPSDAEWDWCEKHEVKFRTGRGCPICQNES